MEAGKQQLMKKTPTGTVQSKAENQASIGTMLDSYKNQAVQQQVIQRVSAVSVDDPYEFEVTRGDLGNGTDTTQHTRDSVNSWKKFPTGINWSYSIYDVGDNYIDGDKGYTSNPPPQKVGQRYDAGHSLGRQNGGLGDDSQWVFPQNPQINRGNRFNGNKTYKQWREPENVFHNAVNDYGKGTWKIKLS